MRDRPNILFIVMDTARARDALPSQNPEKLPNLADLAADGVEFTSAISTAPWTLPSHASMFTGQYTSDHGTHAGSKQFHPDHDPLAKSLQQVGYTTVAFSNNTWISPEFGFDEGFDQFYKGWELIHSADGVTRIPNEYNKLSAQVQSLLKSTSIRSLPAIIINGLYAKFVHKRYDYGAKLTNWKINRWLRSEYEGERPFFMFINYLEPHLKYDPPRKFCSFLPDGVSVREAKAAKQNPWEYVSGNVEVSEHEFEILKGLYDSELHYLDYRIGELRERLSTLSLLNDTIIIVVGDHGENIGDHGLMDHQYSLYDTLVHVPMVIRGRDYFTGGKIVTDVIETRRLFPTVLEAAGVQSRTGNGIFEWTLCDLVGKENESRTLFAISEYRVPQPDIETLRDRASSTGSVDLSRFNRALDAIRTDEWKYIRASDGSEELYDIQSDREEQNDLIDTHPDIAKELRDRLKNVIGRLERGEEQSETVDTTTQQRLEDLGYI